MEKLRTYLFEHRLTQAEFAMRIGLTQGAISSFMKQKTKPSLRTALAIDKATAGAVPPSAWEDDV